MKNRVFKLMTLALTLLLFASGAFACKKDQGGENALDILVFDGGFGTAWAENVADAMEQETGIEVNVTGESLRDKINGEFTKKATQQRYDLYFFDNSLAYYYATETYIIPGVEHLLTDLSDVYTHVPEGETRSIGEKMMPFFRDYYAIDGKYYYLNWAVCSYGIVYNTALISDDEIPVTTDELTALADELCVGGQKAFIFSGKEDYWNQMFYTWWAQYEGVENFNSFFEGKVNGEYSAEIFGQQGRLEAYEVCEDLLLYTNERIFENSASNEFMQAQNTFLEGDTAAMMVNGAWLENESYDYFEGEIPIETDIMRTPVVSGIRDLCTTIADDAELAALIHAIDRGEPSLSGTGYEVNQADYDRVANARKLLYYAGETHNAVVPTTGANPDLAKEFLKFLYSDKGIDAYLSASSCSILPVDVDYLSKPFVNQNYSRLMKTSIEQVLTSELFTIDRRDNLLEDGHIITACKNQSLEFCLGAPNPLDLMTGK